MILINKSNRDDRDADVSGGNSLVGGDGNNVKPLMLLYLEVVMVVVVVIIPMLLVLVLVVVLV